MEIWHALCKTDPRFTKPFNRGNFSGTDINPMWRWRRLTELFGPAGIGWGVETHTANMVDIPGTQEKMICVSVTAWYNWNGEKHLTPPGFGQDYVVRNTQRGLKSDDEAAKKAFTDALGNAFKYIGVSADVFLKMFDDSKYVNDLREKFYAEEESTEDTAENPEDQNDPPAASFPDIPEDRAHLMKMKDGVPMFIHQDDDENATDLANTASWYLSQCDKVHDVLKLVKDNANVLNGLRTAEGKDPIEQGCFDWAYNKLSNTKTERGLKAAWSRIGAEVNEIKDAVPAAHTGISKAFKERKQEVTNG